MTSSNSKTPATSETTASLKAAPGCPAWCAGHPGGRVEPGETGAHAGAIAAVTLSLAGPDEETGGPDHLSVQAWQHAGSAATIAVMRGATDEWLPEMTPAEAVALAAALVRAAWRAGPGAVQAPAAQDAPRHRGTSCPPWCAYGPHSDPGDIHISDGHAIPAASRHHACGYTTGEHADGECERGICAELAVSPGDRPGIELHHGDVCLPAITLSGAEALGLTLLGLAMTGRTGAPGAE